MSEDPTTTSEQQKRQAMLDEQLRKLRERFHSRRVSAEDDISEEELLEALGVETDIADEEVDEDALDRAGAAFLQLVEMGDHRQVQWLMWLDFLMEYRAPRSQQSALHIAAANGARRTAMTLLQSDKVDFLSRDAWGRLPSELAYLFGDDPALARLLAIKERKQAREQGISLARRK